MLEVSVRPDGFMAIVRPSVWDRFGVGSAAWFYLVMAVGMSVFALFEKRPSDPLDWMIAPALLFTVAVLVYHLNRRVYGRDEVVVEGDSLIIRSVGLFGTRTKLSAPSDHRDASSYDVVLSAGTLQYVVVSGGTDRPTARIRYYLTHDDADRLVALITPDRGGAAA